MRTFAGYLFYKITVFIIITDGVRMAAEGNGSRAVENAEILVTENGINIRRNRAELAFDPFHTCRNQCAAIYFVFKFEDFHISPKRAAACRVVRFSQCGIVSGGFFRF